MSERSERSERGRQARGSTIGSWFTRRVDQ